MAESDDAPPHPIVALADGTRVLLRRVVPADREAVLEAFRRLSPDSHYYRFWSRQGDIPDSLLNRFLHADGVNQMTWAAQDPERPDEPGYGGGSYWRSQEDPRRAEISFTVADEAQHRGVGTVLLATLWILAERVGIGEFHGVMLPDNYAVLDWFRRLGARLKLGNGQFEMQLPLDESKLRATPTAERLKARIAELRGVV